jgi:L-ascorbate metabolism protein UlaG (beta-lactamase superfamily)
MFVLLALLGALGVATYFYLQRELFGAKAAGTRLEAMKRSPNYKDGEFVNLRPTPMMVEGYSTAGVMFDFFFKPKPRNTPESLIPSKKIDLKTLDPGEDVLVWFGHSSYFIQLDGKKILVDPVLSGAASPVSFTTKAFAGTDAYAMSDIPAIDYVFISHDHYDHLDHETMVALRPRIGKVICGLGIGAHLEHWGFTKEQIVEQDWYQETKLTDGFIAHTMPARHFSGRTFERNTTLWASYVLVTPTMKLYFGGDSGYDTHFAEIGKKFGSIDLAVLENGQYNPAWRYIHMLPEELPQAAKDLNAKRVLAVHSSKFALASHPWDEPLILAEQRSRAGELPLITPVIGEPVWLRDSTQRFTAWWQGLN